MQHLRIMVLAAMISSAFSSSIGYGADWNTKRLTDNTGSSFNPAIALGGSNVYVVWDDDQITAEHPEIYFLKSSDRGATWQAARRLTYTSGVSKNPDIAADGSKIYVVWEDDTPGNSKIYFRKSANGGATWQSQVRITSLAGGGGLHNPRIAVHRSKIYVVWMGNAAGNINNAEENDEIYMRTSSDGGTTWQAVKRLTFTSTTSWLPAIAVNGSTLYLVWTDYAPMNYEIYFMKSSDEGASWQASKRLSFSSGSSWYPSIAVSGSSLFVVWGDNTPGNNEIYFRKSTNGGASWQGPKRITNTPGHSWNPKIVVRGQNLYVVWNDWTGGLSEIYFRTSPDEGISWQALQNLSNNAGDSRTPSIAIDSSHIHIVWADYTPNNYEIYWTSSSEGTSKTLLTKAGAAAGSKRPF
jgi:hypothetical protein